MAQNVFGIPKMIDWAEAAFPADRFSHYLPTKRESPEALHSDSLMIGRLQRTTTLVRRRVLEHRAPQRCAAESAKFGLFGIIRYSSCKSSDGFNGTFLDLWRVSSRCTHPVCADRSCPGTASRAGTGTTA